MVDDSTEDTSKRVDDLSDDLGFDVLMLEQHVRFRLDLTRMQRGEPAKLGYVLIDRQDHPNAAIVFSTPDEAREAIESHPLVESLAEEDCLDAYVPTGVDPAALIGREIFLP
ncbi:MULTISPECIES: hypothetical protein [Promicromonospora]|uniref:YCII-related domain-containing protein n=2 Tax=Promicromonospora TaxID=43676 RepID=A0ABW4UZZ9_9MICO